MLLSTNTAEINNSLEEIVEKIIALNELSYNDPQYDALEEELHDLEDEFLEAYGAQLEEILTDVHDEYCPDNDVLSPIAYIAKKYKRTTGSSKYDTDYSEGVLVETEDYPSKDTRLVVIPSPLRVKLVIDQKNSVIVWPFKD